MVSKLKRAVKVANHLKLIEFEPFMNFDKTTVYSLKHPYNGYSVWTGNGFWFLSIYKIDGKDVSYSPQAKFGLIGKILVWLEVRKQVKKILNNQKSDVDKWVFKHYND